MLLTGTFGQYRALVPSVENGCFSRLLTVVIPGTNGFDKRYVCSAGGQSIIPQQVGRALLKTYETLLSGEEREWSLTDAQKERIALILSALRLGSAFAGIPASNDASTMHGRLVCSDTDYSTAELIGSKLILHMAAAYKMIEGEKTELVPQIETSCQKQMLYEQLKKEYKLQELITVAKRHGVSRRSAIRWNDDWQENGMVLKTNYGHYKKVG